MRLLPYGDRALLVEVDSTEQVLALADALRGDAAARGLVADVVPGARTVLLVAARGIAVERVREGVSTLDAGTPRTSTTDPAAETRSRVVEVRAPASPPVVEVRAPASLETIVPVVYDGPDLAEVARLTGLSEDEVVAAHTGTPWRVAFGGFAPGFAYLVGGDPRLRVPRRDTPRTTVPAGAVGLAGEFSGVYPRSSPGGWQLVGRTDLVLWDLDRDPPALLSAGATVRFEAVDR